MRQLLIGITILAAALSTACATSGETTTRGSSEVITAEEITAIQVGTAFEAVQRLRPQFLRYRGTTTLSNSAPEGQPTGRANVSGTELVVYVDNVRVGGINVLHNITSERVREIRFLPARDATTKYGGGHMGGVIEVRTR